MPRKPCPHFDVRIIQRSNRQSAVASAAYQSGERLFSEYDQKQKYYSHKSEIVHTEIMLPPHAPPEYAGRNTLWNAALMLAQDFSIPYEDRVSTGRSCPSPKAPPETPEQQFKRMERYAFRVLSDYYHLLRRWEKDLAPQTPEEAWNPLFTEALQNKAKVEYLLDTLLFQAWRNGLPSLPSVERM